MLAAAAQGAAKKAEPYVAENGRFCDSYRVNVKIL
jgi:hypothetical protein